MPLNAREFQKRSEDLFTDAYLNSIGIIQSISLGVLAAKYFAGGPVSLQLVAQMIAAFLAIIIIAHEYSWWILLIRRTPDVLDYLVPYLLGIMEFGVMATVDNTEGAWFGAAGALAIMGGLALFHNRRYAVPALFAECPWLLPRVRQNSLVGIVLVAFATVGMLGAWLFYKHLGNSWKAGVFVVLYAIQVAMLLVTMIFLRDVRKRFEAEQTPF